MVCNISSSIQVQPISTIPIRVNNDMGLHWRNFNPTDYYDLVTFIKKERKERKKISLEINLIHIWFIQ